MAGGTFAGQKRSPIRMHRAAVHEGGVRKFTPLPDGAGPLDAPDKPRPLIQRAAGHPKHAAGIKRQSQGRRRNLRDCGRRAGRRIVAIDAIVRIDGGEYCTVSVDREVLQERARLPRRYRSSFDRSKLSPIVIRIIVFSRHGHVNPSHLHCSQALVPPSTGTASGTSARAARAQSTSVCTVGPPLTPIAPTISPSTLMGNPPPYAATRASVGMPAKSDGSPWIKSKKSCVETPIRAVYALFCAISMHSIGALSIRLKPLRLPPSSRIATFSQAPSSLAFATAASTIFCASSEEMLCFFTTLAIGHLPPLDAY